MDKNLHKARIHSVGFSTIPNRSEPEAVDLKRALIDHGFPERMIGKALEFRTCTAQDATFASSAFLSTARSWKKDA
jgi:hypothetical protein